MYVQNLQIKIRLEDTGLHRSGADIDTKQHVHILGFIWVILRVFWVLVCIVWHIVGNGSDSELRLKTIECEPQVKSLWGVLIPKAI